MLGVSAYPAYLMMFWGFAAAGLCMLWALIRASNAPGAVQKMAFLCLGMLGVPCINLGAQYTLSRFLVGFTALLISHALTERYLSHWPALLIGACYAVLTLATLLISPEIGIAFVLSLLAYSAIAIRQGKRLAMRAVLGYVV